MRYTAARCGAGSGRGRYCARSTQADAAPSFSSVAAWRSAARKGAACAALMRELKAAATASELARPPREVRNEATSFSSVSASSVAGSTGAAGARCAAFSAAASRPAAAAHTKE